MKQLLKLVIYLFSILTVLYLILLIGIYFFQEKLIFFPEKLPEKYKFKYSSEFEEKWIQTTDKCKINELIFMSDSSRGIILYLHGNAGALNSWGNVARLYNSLGYDVCIPDYRGFGKSTGKISSESQFFNDIQLVYNDLRKYYPENKIIIIGYSIGTGPATYITSKNNPSKLILLSPYYNLPYLVKEYTLFLPTFIIKYKFMTNENIRFVKAPISIFHGIEDNIISVTSSKKLIKVCKPNDSLYLLNNQGHIDIEENIEYQKKITQILK